MTACVGPIVCCAQEEKKLWERKYFHFWSSSGSKYGKRSSVGKGASELKRKRRRRRKTRRRRRRRTFAIGSHFTRSIQTTCLLPLLLHAGKLLRREAARYYRDGHMDWYFRGKFISMSHSSSSKQQTHITLLLRTEGKIEGNICILCWKGRIQSLVDVEHDFFISGKRYNR